MGRSDGDSYEFVQGHMWLNSFDMRLTFNGSRQRNPSARERCSEEQGRRKSGTAKISKLVANSQGPQVLACLETSALYGEPAGPICLLRAI